LDVGVDPQFGEVGGGGEHVSAFFHSRDLR
jgi:hypothetical protein